MITIRQEQPEDTVGLAPFAIPPSHQRHGIGADLIRLGLEGCRKAGHECVNRVYRLLNRVFTEDSPIRHHIVTIVPHTLSN